MKKVNPSFVIAARFAAVVALLVAAQPAHAFDLNSLTQQLTQLKAFLTSVTDFKDIILILMMLIIGVWGGSQYNKGEGGGPAYGKMGGALAVIIFLAIVWGVM